jgi:hypothetical protein
VYQIANQKDAAQATHAGHTILLTGETTHVFEWNGRD